MLTINWKGINSDSIPGLIICELPPITKPKMRTTITKIDGRDGDIIEELGYESYTKNIKIGLARNYDINQVIKYFTGSGELVMSNEDDKVYKCKIIDKVDYEKLLRFKTATVKFYTQPYKYKKNLQFYPFPAQSSKAVIWKPANAAIHATAMVYTQMAVAQLHLPVSFFMATKVAMQGK